MHRWLTLTLAFIPVLLSGLRSQPDRLVWWTTDALEKVRPYDAPPEVLTNSVQIAAARNEFEPFQVVLRSESRDIANVDFQASELKSQNGAIISKDNITIYFERFVNVPKPSNIEGKAGEWPDPLIPRVDRYYGETRNAFPFTLINRRNQPVWIEVYVPPSTAAGNYKGRVAVSMGGKPALWIPVNLQVWKFDLPSTSSLKSSFSFNAKSNAVDAAPVANRIFPWVAWKYRIQGEPFDSDKTDIPIESIRLKLIREGLEDYEYLTLLAKHDGAAAVSSFVNQFVTDAYTYDRRPDRLYAMRRQIAERISKE